MSKPNQKKQQKKTARKKTLHQKQLNFTERERVEVLLFEAQGAIMGKRYEAALRCCHSILSSQPENVQALVVYADILELQKRHELLSPVMEKLVSLNPDDFSFQQQLLFNLYRLKKYKTAFETGSAFLNKFRLPADQKKAIKSIVDLCGSMTTKSERIASSTNPQKKRETVAVADKTPLGTEPFQMQTVELDRLPCPSVDSRISLMELDSFLREVPRDKGGLFWMKQLLFLEHERMRNEFEELACTGYLEGVTHFGYQTETVRKVLKVFHGRVLLADEVGLGKTIEASMVLKEYMVRGMVKTVLILCPPSLIDQWSHELKNKFHITAHAQKGHLSSGHGKNLWDSDIVIASLHTAKTRTNSQLVTSKAWDMVIVDEAHHLRNRRTLSWKLVNSIKKKFLLLLSATPVQNDLVELYNLITMLKPGTFPPEKQFLDTYCDSKNRRSPRNAESLRLLLRDVMIRNTRAGCGVPFPKRFASTFPLSFTLEEKRIYEDICVISCKCTSIDSPLLRLSVRTVLERAGAYLPLAAASLRSLAVLLRSRRTGGDMVLCEEIACKCDACVEALSLLPHTTAKMNKLVALLKEGKGASIIFCRHTNTVHSVCGGLLHEGISFTPFHGAMSQRERTDSIEQFRCGEARVLVSSESGGEGQNLQFCNSLINFDLPWNPMQIEQRIGRIHRIGQASDVFVFNLCYAGTIEERILGILENKIRMFELVIGEVDSILGSLDEQGGFSEVVMDLWVKNSDNDSRKRAFEDLGEKLTADREQYMESCRIDEQIFGREMEA